MICEAALCLALDERDDEGLLSGGVLTPASACGQALIDRLVATGIEFRVLERS
jgi:saccharopine dehydrogenase (NAD+, L-glutamate forming)